MTLGYYTYKEILVGGPSRYPYLSAYGLMMTLVITPIVLGMKKFLDRFDPYMRVSMVRKKLKFYSK